MALGKRDRRIYSGLAMQIHFLLASLLGEVKSIQLLSRNLVITAWTKNGFGRLDMNLNKEGCSTNLFHGLLKLRCVFRKPEDFLQTLLLVRSVIKFTAQFVHNSLHLLQLLVLLGVVGGNEQLTIIPNAQTYMF